MTAEEDPVPAALRPWLSAARARGILLAVSGGPDSTALLHAVATLGSPVPVSVATVDHGLRPAAAESSAGSDCSADDSRRPGTRIED